MKWWGRVVGGADEREGVFVGSPDGHRVSLTWSTRDQTGLRLPCRLDSPEDHFQFLPVLLQGAVRAPPP